MNINQPVFLGIDTSCYSTSLALVDSQNNLIFERRWLLPVESGAKGLRQSQAFFYHHKNLPLLIKEMQEVISFPLAQRLAGIAVSAKPCQSEDSYMPVFLAGASLANSLAAAMSVPIIETTHQEGHLMAALWSTQIEPELPILAFHLSGGTTDLILVKKISFESKLTFDYQVLLSSSDIPAGQLVDRIGVDLGLNFPAGPALEKLAATLGQDRLPQNSIPTNCRKDSISFSGAETSAKKLVDLGIAPSEVARSIEHCIATTLEKAVDLHSSNSKEIIFMGGVAGNQYIQQRLIHRLQKRHNPIKCFFAESKFSSDNAVGVALIGAASINLV